MEWVHICLAPWCLNQRTDSTDGYNPSAYKQGSPLAHHLISSIPEHLLLPITALHCTGYLSCILSQIPRPDCEPLEGRKPWFFFILYLIQGREWITITDLSWNNFFRVQAMPTTASIQVRKCLPVNNCVPGPEQRQSSTWKTKQTQCPSSKSLVVQWRGRRPWFLASASCPVNIPIWISQWFSHHTKLSLGLI